jgi:hypothetical protein
MVLSLMSLFSLNTQNPAKTLTIHKYEDKNSTARILFSLTFSRSLGTSQYFAAFELFLHVHVTCIPIPILNTFQSLQRTLLD